MRIAGALAHVAALLTLIVVAASATIRLGADALGDAMTLARGVHRAAASLAALVVLALFWRGLRVSELRRAASLAFVLMLALSAVGWATGTQPPPAAALFNQLGGIVLAALLAWAGGRTSSRPQRSPDRPLARLAMAFAGLQIAFGAALMLLDTSMALVLWIAHAVAGLATAAIAAALGVRLARAGEARRAVLLIGCAALAPFAGIAAVLPAPPLAVQVAHAALAAVLLCALANAHGAMSGSA